MDKSRGFAAIILAAGFSSRMGDFKPLLKLGSATAIEHAIRCFLQAGIGDIRVVTGYRSEVVKAAVEPFGVKVIHNAGFETGMYSSVQAVVETLGPEVQAFFLLPADHPLVLPATVKRILEGYKTSGKNIVYPVFQGRRGHPPLISTSYVQEILQGPAPDGLRGLLYAHESDALEVAVTDEAVLLDMDVPEDYQYLLDYLEKRSVPTQKECQSLLLEAAVERPVWEHCHMVAGLAAAFVKQLNLAGSGLDEDLVMAGALLHDVARQEPRHAEAGARFIQAKGYPQVAELVAVHMDITVAEDAPLSEAEVVYLADKMVKGRSVVTISDRLASVREKFQNNHQARQAAEYRLLQAERIRAKIEKVLGLPVTTVSPLEIEESQYIL